MRSCTARLWLNSGATAAGRSTSTTRRKSRLRRPASSVGERARCFTVPGRHWGRRGRRTIGRRWRQPSWRRELEPLRQPGVVHCLLPRAGLGPGQTSFGLSADDSSIGMIDVMNLKGSGSKWSLWSTDSVLSIGSRGSMLSIGSIGSVLSVGSIGSALSALSVGSSASLGSLLSARSRFSILSYGSDKGVLAPRQRSVRPSGEPRRGGHEPSTYSRFS
jgi:hypothetical protein